MPCPFALLADPKKRDLACVAGGMGLLLAGGKLSALALFAKGLHGLERRWRADHAFEGTWRERMERSAAFYEGTHQDPTNRLLHRVGIPLIVGGAAGLLAFPRFTPPWLGSWGLFTGGWVLNFIGHGVYEKNAPAFAADPLSFLMGPLWDLKQVRDGGRPLPVVEPAAGAPASAARPAPRPEPIGAGA